MNWADMCKGFAAVPGSYIKVLYISFSYHYCRDRANGLSDLFSITCILCLVRRKDKGTNRKIKCKPSQVTELSFLYVINTGWWASATVFRRRVSAVSHTAWV